MRKVLLAMAAVVIIATMAPAHALTATYTRTIAAPTTFGDGTGVISLPSILNNPTDPSQWSKIGTSTTAARCAYVKEKEGVLPAGSSQDNAGGKLGYVVALPSAFGTGDSFSLKAHADNASYDFDAIFFTGLGKCAYDRTVSLPGGQGCLTVPLEGAPPNPLPRETQESSSTCFPGGPKSMYTKIGNDSGALTFDANFALIVMPIGANGKFTLTITYS